MNFLKHLICLGFIALALTPSALAEQTCQRENTPQLISDLRFTYDEQNVVIDKQTGLMWATCVDGMSGKQCESGSPALFTWGEALQRASEMNANGGFANYNDWRVPTIRELITLVDTQCMTPSVHIGAFPNTPATHSWTSSPYHTLTFYSWYVDFSTGETNSDDRVNKKNIRLVRLHKTR